MTGPAELFPVGTFAPDPRPAPPGRRITATAGLELRMTLRNGEQLLLALVIPLLALIGGTLVSVVDLPEPRVDAVVPGVVVLAVLSTAFTSQAITTGFDRRYGVLKRLAAAGVGRAQLIAGKCAATLAVIAGQFVILGGTGLLLGWRPAGSPLWVLAITLLGTAAFIGLALLLGGTLRAEAVLALANLLWVLLLGLGLLLPTDQLPGALGTVAALLPSGALGDAVRLAFVDGGWPWTQWAVLVGWGLVGALLGRRFFRWGD